MQQHRHQEVAHKVYPVLGHTHLRIYGGTTVEDGHSHPDDDRTGPMPGSAASLTGPSRDTLISAYPGERG